MKKLILTINDQRYEIADVVDDMPLLWLLRDELNLVGTKFGCGGGFCGACTVHVDGVALRACSIPAVSLAGKSITTIEGLAKGGQLHPLQQAWIDLDVPQCGYCQAGQIMGAAALLAAKAAPTDADIDRAMQGNLCRCACYPRIRQAIKRASRQLAYDAMPSNTQTESTQARSTQTASGSVMPKQAALDSEVIA